jgi:hypothetical protein
MACSLEVMVPRLRIVYIGDKHAHPLGQGCDLSHVNIKTTHSAPFCGLVIPSDDCQIGNWQYEGEMPQGGEWGWEVGLQRKWIAEERVLLAQVYNRIRRP